MPFGLVLPVLASLWLSTFTIDRGYTSVVGPSPQDSAPQRGVVFREAAAQIGSCDTQPLAPAPAAAPEKPLDIESFQVKKGEDGIGLDLACVSLGEICKNGRYIKTNDETICKKYCLRNSECVGYTFNAPLSACIMKARIWRDDPQGQAVSRGLLAERHPAAGMPLPPIPRPLFTTAKDTDAPEGDLREWILGPMTIQDCENFCLTTQFCQGYTFNERLRVCIRKEKILGTRSFSNAITGSLQPIE